MLLRPWLARDAILSYSTCFIEEYWSASSSEFLGGALIRRLVLFIAELKLTLDLLCFAPGYTHSFPRIILSASLLMA